MDRMRVIVWGTGFVGLSVLRNLITHPAYEVVGVLVNDPAKDGRDVGAHEHMHCALSLHREALEGAVL